MGFLVTRSLEIQMALFLEARLSLMYAPRVLQYAT